MPNLGTLIRNAREAEGLTLRSCSAALGIDHTALCRYEVGERFPSANDARPIADFLGISREELEALISSERNLQRSRPEISQSQFLPLPAIEAVAANDRSRFLRTIQRSQLHFPRDRDDIPHYLFGLQVIYDSTLYGEWGKQIFAGLYPPGSFFREESGVIAVATLAAKRDRRTEVSEETKTFHVMHELGHYRLHWRASEPIVPSTKYVPIFCSSGDHTQVEYQANAYASSFLMPRSELLAILNGRRVLNSQSDTTELCREFFVEPWMLRLRLNAIGIRVAGK